LVSSIKANPRLRAAAEELRKGGVKVSDAVSEALKSMEESEVIRHVSPTMITSDKVQNCLLCRSPVRLQQSRHA
jgi:import inner membrane translocase subunit TIM44